MTTPKRHKSFDIPTDRYLAFRSLLRDLLMEDGSFKASYLLGEIESKLLDPLVADPPDQRRKAAINKWLACEDLNRDTNVRLMHMDETDVLFTQNGFPVSAPDIAETAARFISRTLGPVPLDGFKGSYSGGASTSIKRGVGTIARKYLGGTDITEGAIWHFLRLTKSVVWAPRDFRCVRGNVLFTVPKTSKIDRCAAKEPDHNMYAQLAVGNYISKRLMRVGINLRDQSVNQRLAREGAAKGDLATVDLSAASDSMTTQLILRLLPDEWFYLLQDLRSPETEIDGSWHLNEMFSSMGNGFTFPLESLVFWALTRAVAFHSSTKGRISVYGDDIICPSGLDESLVATLEFFGFRTNVKKSFFKGPFRESCGSHWHSTEDVTPFYVKELPVNVVDWIRLLNQFRKWCTFDSVIADPRYYDLWNLFAEELIPRPVWGGDDFSRMDFLVVPGLLPLARIVRKQRTCEAEEKRLSYGAYLHWLDLISDRGGPTSRDLNDSSWSSNHVESEGHVRIGSAIVTSSMKIDSSSAFTLRRVRKMPRLPIPEFP